MVSDPLVRLEQLIAKRHAEPVRVVERVPMRRVFWGLYKKWTTETVIYRSWLWGAYVTARERVMVARRVVARPPVPPQGGSGVVRAHVSVDRLEALQKYVEESFARSDAALARTESKLAAMRRPPPTSVPGSGVPVARRAPMSAAEQAAHASLAADPYRESTVDALLDSED